jgi:hypothetical protein
MSFAGYQFTHLKRTAPLLAHIFICLAFFVATLDSEAQVVKISPLEGSVLVKDHGHQTQAKSHVLWGILDTLELPFFEDFTHQYGYPTSFRWADKQVWVNNSFCPDAPNANVATFDHLNAWGNPYQTLTTRESTYADSLTSQPINLQFYKRGANTFPYRVTDGIILSFFFKNQGLGDVPELEDSLVLFFKTQMGTWRKVWGANGAHNQLFKEVFVALDSQDYLIPDFQFRFVNYTKKTGNLNHWHIDYIRLDQGRIMGGLSDIEDVSIVTGHSGLFQDYSNIPYHHYKNQVTTHSGKAKLRVRNLNELATVQTRFQLSIQNDFGQTLFQQNFSASSRNIMANSDSTETFETPYFDTLSGASPSLNYQFLIDPQSNDQTPDNYNARSDNNAFTLKHQFLPWYAYDDGSAEGGIGLDYAYLGNIPGQFAMEFNTVQDDSLRGLAIYFTQAKEDVSFRSFNLRIWKKLSPLGSDDRQDQLMYEFSVDRPIYRDSINHFEYFFFDSVLFLPKGQYYVGWHQRQPFVLNVGYDNNYRFGNQPQAANPRLFYNLLGSWERADYQVKGTPMIRMLFGERMNYRFATERIKPLQLNVFPNPAQHWLKISPVPGKTLKEVSLWDLNGKRVLQGKDYELWIAELPKGTYFVHAHFQDGQKSTAKVIIGL